MYHGTVGGGQEKKPRCIPRVLRPRGGRIRIPPPMARAPIEGPEQLFHFAEAAVPATTLPVFEPVRVVAEPVESVLGKSQMTL